MSRMFDTHKIRETRTLDGMWDFRMEGFEKAYTMPVPGCWEQHPDFAAHRGVGTYTKTVYVKKSGNIRLEFKGVSHTGDVYFDGKKVAHHYNAFTPFSCVIQHAEEGEHELVVVVNNTFCEESSLHVPNDYYTYGGITRPVVMEQIPDVYIKYVHFTPACANGKWSGKTEVCIANLSDERRSVNITVDLAGKNRYAAQDIPANTEQLLTFEDTFEDIIPWNPEHPQLYTLTATVTVGGICDDLIDRVGFRTVSIDENKLYVNGEPVFLKGVNRHEDYANLGCAIPVQLMAADLDLIQDLGANAIRTCHYPNDERFLDMCDERGILLWEENHARGFGLERMKNPHFEQQCADCIHEMIENHYNHPAIVIWGIMNECASETPEGRAMYEKQFAQVKALDTTRPTSFATCRHFTDISLDLPDIVSYNIYTGWYTDGDTVEEMDAEIGWIKQSGGDHKPIIISEFGAGGVYGFRDRTHCRWSEERQAEILEDTLQVFLYNEQLTGIFIWLFADCRVTEEEWCMSRPKTQNNKGLVDVYRRPKLAYDVVKKLLHKQK